MVGDDRVDEILKIATPEQQAEIHRLVKAAERRRADCRIKATDANMNMWKAAEDALKDYLGRIESDLLDDVQQPAAEETKSVFFKNIPEVYGYLQGLKIKIGIATLYKDQKKGYIRPDDQGRFSLAMVQTYMEVKNLTHKNGSKVVQDENAKKKSEADARIALAKAAILERKDQLDAGLVILTSKVERDNANKARVLKSGILTTIRINAPSYCECVNGDFEKIPDLIQLMTEDWLTHFDQYARG